MSLTGTSPGWNVIVVEAMCCSSSVRGVIDAHGRRATADIGRSCLTGFGTFDPFVAHCKNETAFGAGQTAYYGYDAFVSCLHNCLQLYRLIISMDFLLPERND